jgi:serine/threonine-protein kinase RsbW
MLASLDSLPLTVDSSTVATAVFVVAGFLEQAVTVMCRLSPRSAQIVIRNRIAELATLRDRLDAIGLRHGIGGQTLAKLQVALDELASNVIKYGWPEGGDHEVRVRFAVRRDRVEIEIVDDGLAFDPRGAPEPLPSSGSRRLGGLGLHIVRKLVDRIDYERLEGHNRTVVTKLYDRRDADRGSPA